MKHNDILYTMGALLLTGNSEFEETYDTIYFTAQLVHNTLTIVITIKNDRVTYGQRTIEYNRDTNTFHTYNSIPVGFETDLLRLDYITKTIIGVLHYE